MSGVVCEIGGGAAILRLENAAKLNALTPGMLRDLESHLVEAERNDGVRCVVVTGEGDRVFCAGADIDAWSALDPAEFVRSWVRDGHRIFDRLARLSKPTIAALNGHAMGGGLELAAACDARIMAPEATLALPEARVGVVPGWSGTQRMTRLLPEPMVKEMVLFGRRILAKRALQLGFVADLSEDPLSAARSFIREMPGLSPRAVETAKYMIHAGAGEDRAAMIDALASAAIARSEDRAEGVAAFREKRKPDFEGK